MAEPWIHPYMPNSVPEIKESMLKAIGVSSVEELYAPQMGELRYTGAMNLPEPITGEYDLVRHMNGVLRHNRTCEEYDSFLGAGCYRHYVPAICDEINSRAEFLTGYCGDTYSDHGKMQAIFEYSSLMAELLDLDVVSYTTYDAGQAVNSSLRMALRIQEAEGHPQRVRLLLPATMNPEIRSQINDYCKAAAELTTIRYNRDTGLMDLLHLKEELDKGGVAAVFYENPSYLGYFETGAEEIAALAHSADALVVAQCEAASLGVVESPANYGADIVCGEVQPLGMHIQYGGGCAGFIATRYEERFIQQYPTYLYGITKTQNKGEYGWGRALNYRCSHGAREKAKEYFGTGTGLWCITAAVYLSLLGPEGMREVGESTLQRLHYLRGKLGMLPGVRIRFGAGFQELVADFSATGKTVAEINNALLERGIFGGKDLSADFPELGQSALYAVTEITGQDAIDRLFHALQEILKGES